MPGLFFTHQAIVAHVFLSVAMVYTAHGKDGSSGEDRGAPPEVRACSVFCGGPLLQAMQEAKLPQFGNDSKTFVDCPLLAEPETVLDAFQELPRPLKRNDLEEFARTYFGNVAEDLEPWQPPDWPSMSPMLKRARARGGMLYQNLTLRNWTQTLHSLWKELGRRPAASVYSSPQRHTLLETKHGLIVPGGRFRENYYCKSFHARTLFFFFF